MGVEVPLTVPFFQYTASDRTGSISKGEVEAKDRASASRLLSSEGLFVLEIFPSASSPAERCPESPCRQRRQPSSQETETTTATEGASKRRHRLRWPSTSQAIYLRQLNVMFDAGIPLHQAAYVVGASHHHNPEVQRALLEIPRDLERGRMLSKCLERSGLFERTLVSSVRLAEESGRLGAILRNLADAKEQSVKLRRRLVSRLTYPLVVMTIMSLGLLVLGHLMSQVMSSLANLRTQDLPLFGRVCQVFGHPVFLPGCLLLSVVGSVLAYRLWRTASLRRVLERQFLGLPVAGTLLSRIETNIVTGHISILISAGLPIDRGLELCADLVWTECFRQALLDSVAELRAGAELAECFQSSGLFPNDTLALISAGEVSGRLGESLTRASLYCSDQVERTLDTLLALIEPLLIGFLGIVIGSILIGTFVPVFNSLQSM